MQTGGNTHRIEGKGNVDGDIGGSAGIIVFHWKYSFHGSEKIFRKPKPVQIGYNLLFGQVDEVIAV